MDIEQKILVERVRALYQQTPALFTGLLFSSAAIAFFFWERAEQDVVRIWLASILILIVVRLFFVWKFYKISLTDFNPHTWGWGFAIGSSVSGIINGTSLLLFLDFSEPVTVIFLTLIMFGTQAGSVAALSFFLPSYYLYSLFTISPLIVLFYIEGGTLYLFSILLFVFLVAHLLYSYNMYKTVVSSIRQRFENQELLIKLKQQTRIAEQANRDKSRFLAATSHDLRQPLHSLGLFLSVLRERLNTPKQKLLMEKTERSQRALSEQLNSIVDITRIDAGELSVHNQPIHLKTFVDDLISEFVLIAKKKNVNIKSRIIDGWIETDPVLLARIIRNLISNATQHCPGATLLVASRKRGDDIELIFVDNGPGIVDSEQSSIFSEFYQLNNPERDRNKGMGLGLSIVHRLTCLLDIPLELKSIVNKGSCFSLMLPQHNHDTEMNNIEGIEADFSADIAGLFVVVVDDESENLDAMRSLLMDWGCEVLMAEDEATLMTELTSANYPMPDILLIDYRLRDDKNGFEVIEAVRKHFERIIPAAIITGDTTLNLESKLNIERCDLLYKPLASASLQRWISQLAYEY
ncbi:MAG: response regulator [Gammaproteobacteria bacterium]|nr:response regulator [Gammaproteobacteria bacterium]